MVDAGISVEGRDWTRANLYGDLAGGGEESADEDFVFHDECRVDLRLALVCDVAGYAAWVAACCGSRAVFDAKLATVIKIVKILGKGRWRVRKLKLTPILQLVLHGER
jgi:hypothetical protein